MIEPPISMQNLTWSTSKLRGGGIHDVDSTYIDTVTTFDDFPNRPDFKEITASCTVRLKGNES